MTNRDYFPVRLELICVAAPNPHLANEQITRQDTELVLKHSCLNIISPRVGNPSAAIRNFPFKGSRHGEPLRCTLAHTVRSSINVARLRKNTFQKRVDDILRHVRACSLASPYIKSQQLRKASRHVCIIIYKHSPELELDALLELDDCAEAT